MTKLISILSGITFFLSTLVGVNVDLQGREKPASIGVLTSDEEGVLLELIIPSYKIDQVSLASGSFDQVSIPGADVTAVPGEPQLPVFNALIGVPPNAEVSLEILSDQSTPIHGSYTLIPAPSVKRPEADLQPGQYTYLPYQEIYTSNTLLPENSVQVIEDGWMRDLRIVRIAFYPLQYNPAQGTLLWHQSLQVKLNFTQSPGEKIAVLQQENDVNHTNLGVSNNPFENVLKNNLLNYEAAQTWRTLEPSELDSLPAMPTLQSPSYKVTIDHDGLYQITYDDLIAAGMNLAEVDPRNFHMTNQGQDVAIYVTGEQDGNFGPDDRITFYGEHFRGDRLAQIYADEDKFWLDRFIYGSSIFSFPFDAQLNATMFEKYTAENVYWLMIADTPGPRMAELDGSPASAEVPSYYWETVHEEESHIWWSWHFTDEDTWFWDVLITSNTTPVVSHTYTTTLSAIATGPYSATIRGELVDFYYNDYASPDHHTQFFLNEMDTLIDDATWDGHAEYTFEVQTPQENLVEGENALIFQALDTIAIKTDDWLYFDWFEIEYARQFKATSNQLNFSNHEPGTYQYQSYGFTDDNIQVFDITNPINPTRVLNPVVSNTISDTYTATFQTTHAADARYFVAAVGDSTVINSPLSIQSYVPQDFNSISGADYIFITHHDFITATQTLADYRSNQGLTTLVVDVDELYNQFNYGIFHPLAIKNFLSFTFANWDNPPYFVNLIGSGHWDLRYYGSNSIGKPVFMPPYLAFVDPWQGEVDSANLLANVVGDDILPDLAIGRIPVKSAEELYNIINKIMIFEAVNGQSWQHNLLFVADNIPDDAGDFIASSEEVISNHLAPGFKPIRIYQNDYGCTSSGSTACKAVTNAITTTVNTTGTLFIHYTGHGANQRWSGQNILNVNHLSTLNNLSQPSIFLEMTCLTGYWIHTNPAYSSLAVQLLTHEDGGAVSTFSPTGLGVGLGHDQLQIGFYDAIFKSGVKNLGAATLAAKLNLFQAGFSRDLIHTYTIFGDPALIIPLNHTIYLPSVLK